MNTFLVWLLQFVLPRKKWYREYYLQSNHWKRTRRRKLEQVGYRCKRCAKPKRVLDVHHLTYARLFHERMSDLEALCRYHHNKEHAQ